MRAEREDRPDAGRRAVVAGACVAALGCVAGCGSRAPSTSPPAPPGDGVPSGGLAPPSGVGVGTAGTRLGPASDVPAGGARVYPNLETVVTQPTPGTYRGLSALCTHDGCLLMARVPGELDCPCHGSRFRLDGTVIAGPAASPLPARPVTIVDGAIVLA